MAEQGLPDPLNVTVSVFNESTGWVLPDVYVERVRKASRKADVRVAHNRHELRELLGDTHVLFGWSMSEEDLRERGGSLRWAQLTTAGADTILSIPAVAESSIELTTAAGVHRVQASEHAMMLILALARQLHRCVRAQVDRQWIGGALGDAMLELHDHTLGIVALGEIGQAIAERAKAFGMHVVATKKNPEGDYLFVDRVMGAGDLNEMLGLADVVVVAVPLTKSTRGMIGARQLRAMKPHALLVNVSRGGVVDEAALVAALQNRQIGGAALDVFDEEPLPSDSPFWALENVIVTPHVAGISSKYWERCTALFCENLRRYLEGRPLAHRVDRRAGY